VLTAWGEDVYRAVLMRGGDRPRDRSPLLSFRYAC